VIYRELLIGCGHSRRKHIDPLQFDGKHQPASQAKAWRGLLETMDSNTDCRPDICWDLENTPWQHHGQFGLEPMRDSTYDEIHAYEVLEHLGRQGDFVSFFETFSEIWRILKPNGYLAATCPSRYSEWLWADPGHTRAVLPASLVFLDQSEYTKQQGITPMSNYRAVYRADFEIVYSNDNHHTHSFVLRAVKPSRIQAT